MTLLNKTFTASRKYLVLILIFVSIAIANIWPTELLLSFFYFKNGKTITIDGYKIRMPFLHWAYMGESKITYVVMGKNIGTYDLVAEFFKNTENLNIHSAISSCDSVEKKVYKGTSITGNIYLCMKNRKESMYFQSNDKKILIRADDYNSSNTEIIKAYYLLLENIKNSD